ncbi:hypothetical protein WG906_04710 [Pedobacter sp. P351]|uniref:hypothetical protein n=1 Tax=Pedobacter superstes TaxID=3133441 RepID=UPI0030B6717B
MKTLLLLMQILTTLFAQAQVVIFDRHHFNIVNENGLMRYSAETSHNNYLNNIKNKLNDINLNMNSVILVQSMIKGSLTQVNNVLKSGLAVKQVGSITSEILKESNDMIDLARSEPYLLLFAEDNARQLKSRGLRLAFEVSDFILKEGDNVLMDFEKRDFLLRKVILELKVMRALCFSMHKSIYWAKMNGVLKTANPYRHFINRDKRLIDEITRNYKTLKN